MLDDLRRIDRWLNRRPISLLLLVFNNSFFLFACLIDFVIIQKHVNCVERLLEVHSFWFICVILIWSKIGVHSSAELMAEFVWGHMHALKFNMRRFARGLFLKFIWHFIDLRCIHYCLFVVVNYRALILSCWMVDWFIIQFCFCSQQMYL